MEGTHRHPRWDPEQSSKNIEDVAQIIEEVMQSEGYAVTRSTDLEVLPQYLATQQSGTLHVSIYTTDPTVESEADIQIIFGRTTLGDYIIPWKSESIAAEITNGFCYLRTAEGDIFFSGVQELFFGDHKAFMVCTGTPQGLPVNTLGEGDGNHS